MRALILSIGCFCILNLQSQSFYQSSSPGSDWTSSDAVHIASSGQVVSNGYSASNSSPGASSGANAEFFNCTASGSLAILTSPTISSVGKSNIRIGFGRRITSAFSPSVNLEWFDGGSWNSLGNAAAGIMATGTWETVFYDLPSGANNISTLQFRFSFTTNVTTGCAAAANFRIDDFWVGANNKLPIQLASFNITPAPHPILQWTTLAELNNDHFSLERSRDGLEYVQIALIDGNGTTDKQNDYTYSDLTPYPGMNYYRLSQVDLNGFSISFPIKSVWVPVYEIAVYPTVFKDKIKVDLPIGSSVLSQWIISDLSGHLCSSGFLGAGGTMDQSIDLSILPDGFYILRIQSNIQQKIFKLIKRG